MLGTGAPDTHLDGVEAVVHHGNQVDRVQVPHPSDRAGGQLECRQAHVKINIIQVPAIKSVQLTREEVIQLEIGTSRQFRAAEKVRVKEGVTLPS